MAKKTLATLKVWDKVKMFWMKWPFTVMARDDRFIIMNNGWNTYSIVDVKRKIMWPHTSWNNLHINTKAWSESALKWLQEWILDISHRSQAKVKIDEFL